MNKIVLSGIVAAAGLAASAQAQTVYQFEMRLIADGEAGAPSGPGATFNIGDRNNVTVSRIGFWLQARVAQDGGQNWGITRASSPAGGGASLIAVVDPTGATAFGRGTINGGGTLFGRGLGYRNGGANSGNTGNTVGNAPFPGGAGNENGGLDNGGAGAMMTRIYGFDAYVGSTRADTDLDGDGDVDDDGDGLPEQPWRVNGANANAGVNGVPHPSDGTFAPWANLYRIWIDVGSLDSVRDITITASALLNGAVQGAPTSVGGANYAMQLGAGQTLTTTYVFSVVPTPGAAAMLGLGGLAAMRRRR